MLSGVKEIREVVAEAKRRRAEQGEDCVLFVDEVHRFNKSQQDAFLPHVEDGTVIFVGATTENPSFELNNALLSRARVYVLEALDAGAIEAVIDRALADAERGLGAMRIGMAPGLRRLLAEAADGDARRALNLLEIAADLATDGPDGARILAEEAVLRVLEGGSGRRFDKGGDAFYDQISALHKAIRGSSPDGALYWLARMLDGGCDPPLPRAAPRAHRLRGRRQRGPEGAHPGARRMGGPGAAGEPGRRAGPRARRRVHGLRAEEQRGLHRIRRGVAGCARAEVPRHLRNAPTRLLESLGHGEGYRYAHDEPEGYAAGEHYLPDALQQRRYYEPVGRGLEERIGEKLRRLRALDEAARAKRRRGGEIVADPA